MSVAEMGWEEAQRYWADQFAKHGFDGVRIVAGVFYLRRRESGEHIWLTEEGVAPSKLAWLIQQGFAEGALGDRGLL